MIKIVSFGNKHRQLPDPTAEYIDCRGFKNPHDVPSLRTLTGLDPKVKDFVVRDSAFMQTLNRLILRGAPTRPIYFGCFGGRHRSVAMAELAAKAFRTQGHAVTVEHLELT